MWQSSAKRGLGPNTQLNSNTNVSRGLMRFADYYGLPFRNDLRLVVEFAPRPNHLSEPDGLILQPLVISCANPAIVDLGPHRRRLFATALVFTVLMDQVCYTYYRNRYEKFRQLTMYPKWKGDCPGGCHNNVHPRLVLETIGRRPARRGERNDYREFHDVLAEARPVIRADAESFFREHLPDVDAAQFWERCQEAFP